MCRNNCGYIYGEVELSCPCIKASVIRTARLPSLERLCNNRYLQYHLFRTLRGWIAETLVPKFYSIKAYLPTKAVLVPLVILVS